MRKLRLQLSIMITYGITLIIWLCVNLFAEAPVYADTSVMGENFYTKNTAKTTSEIITEITTEITTQTTAENTDERYIPEFLENYVCGSLAAEMPVYFQPEALKAQAVACRTYACREYFGNKNVELKTIGQAYLSEDRLKQRWGGDYEKNMQKIKDAVTQTRGEVIVYDDEPILAAYSSASGGMTEDSGNVWGRSLPYLRPVNSEYDKKAPVYLQETSIETERLSAVLGVDNAADIRIDKRSQSGYVLGVTAGGKRFSGDDIRLALGLGSNNFYLDVKDGRVFITVHGYGHGAGMSQYGAEYMAQSGAGYREILSHYYTDVDFKVFEVR